MKRKPMKIIPIHTQYTQSGVTWGTGVYEYNGTLSQFMEIAQRAGWLHDTSEWLFCFTKLEADWDHEGNQFNM